MTFSMHADLANAAATAYAAEIGSGPVIKVYTGTKPATPETAATGDLLASIPLTGALSVVGATITSGDPVSVLPSANGTPGWFRLEDSGGTARIDGTVSVNGAGGDMQVNNLNFDTTVPVDCGPFTIVVPTQ